MMRLIVLIFLSTIIYSCDSNRLYDEYVSIENGWDINNQIRFSFKKPEPETPCNVYINLINNNDYRFNNIFLIITLEAPTGLTKVDTLEYVMADETGAFLGKGITDYKENKLWYKKNTHFIEEGEYKISIQQAVRKQNKVNGVEHLQGISKVGLRIESVPNN